MPAPFPYDAVGGRKSIKQYAIEVAANYIQLARQWNDAGADADTVNPKNVLQARELAGLLNTALTEPFGAGNESRFAVALRAKFAEYNIEWPDDATMMADILSVRDAGLSFASFVKANVPSDYGKLGYDEQDRRIEIVEPLDKGANAALVTELQVARATLGDDPLSPKG